MAKQHAVFRAPMVGVLLATLAACGSASSSTQVGTWVRAHAHAIPSVDDPQGDTALGFLAPMVGSARVLAIGELLHCGHEPLAFRNEVIRYAVKRLGFRALALESGLTESRLIERYIEGGPVTLDSAARRGFTWEFGAFPENQQLLEWLREYNRTNTDRVRFYGIDVTGGGDDNSDPFPGGRAAPRAALDYLNRVDSRNGKALTAIIVPLLDRFSVPRYHEYSEAERQALTDALRKVQKAIVADSTRAIAATSAAEWAHAVRAAWSALRQADIYKAANGTAGVSLGVLRDSTMAENMRWVLDQEGRGRVIVFAHNAHVMNRLYFWPGPDSASIKMLGQYMRAMLGTDLVVMASATKRPIGLLETPLGSTSLEATLSGTGVENFVVDLREADSDPGIAREVDRDWPFRVINAMRPVNPRRAMDLVAYFDHDTRTGPTRLSCNGEKAQGQ